MMKKKTAAKPELSFVEALKRGSSVAEIRHDYHGIRIYADEDDPIPNCVRASYRGRNSAFDAKTGAEIAGDLPEPQKRRIAEWFRSERKTDMGNWSGDASGHWHRPPVRPACYDLDKPLSKDNDFWADMQILRAIPYKNYDIELWFANGSHKIYNMKRTIAETPEFAPLRKLNVFMDLIGIGSGLHWNEDVDCDAYEFFKYGKDI